MQALGSYAGGRMLLLGLGTDLGSTLITENVIVPIELGELPYGAGERLGAVVGRRGLKRNGKRTWRRVVERNWWIRSRAPSLSTTSCWAAATRSC